MPDLNFNLLGQSLRDYFIDYARPTQRTVIDPVTNQPVIENGVTKTETVYETPLTTLSEDNFNRALTHFQVPSDSGGVRSHLFETLDLDGNRSLTLDEMSRAVQILIDLAGRTGMTQGLSAYDWTALKGSEGALKHAFTETFCGVSLLELFRRTGDTSNTKAYFQITKSEFTDLMERVGLFRDWDPKRGLLQHKQHAISYLWGLFNTRDDGEAVVMGSKNLPNLIADEVTEKIGATPRLRRYESFFERQGGGLLDAHLTIEELEGICRAALGGVLDTFLNQLYRDQQRMYTNLSQAIKEMNR